MKRKAPLFERADGATCLSPGAAPPLDKGRREVSFTSERRERFLQALREGYSPTKAARAAGAGRRTVYDWRERDADFRRLWDEALDEGSDLFEDRMRELALEKGGFLATMATLRARRREKWGDHLDVRQTSTLRIVIHQPPSAEDLLADDAKMAVSVLPEPNPLRDEAVEGEYRELPTPEGDR